MADYIVTFRSVTPAQRGERLLHRMNIRCTLQRTPRWMEAQGCGYSLRIYEEQIQRVMALFWERNLPFRKVYRVDDNGKTEEIAL